MGEKKYTVLKWLVGLLIVFNIAILATLWLRPELLMKQPKRESPAQFLESKMHFSAEQTKQYEQLRDEHHHAMIGLQEDGRMLRKRLFDNLKTDNPNNAVTDTVSMLIGNNQQQIEQVTFDHFKKVRMLCTPEQKAIFDNIIDEMMRRMAGPMGGPHGPNGPHGPHEPEEGGPPPPPPGQ